MKKLRQSGKKGEYGYIRQEKKRRLITTLLFFAVPVLILIIGLLIFKTRENLLTVGAVVLCLPAGKRLVSLIMIMLYQPMKQENYDLITKHSGSLTMVYETVLTNYEKNTMIDAFAICGNQVVGYTSSDKADIKYVEEHTQKILRHNEFKGVTVKILKDLNHFIDRLDSLKKNEGSLRADIPFKPDEKYPNLSREELIRHTILAISL